MRTLNAAALCAALITLSAVAPGTARAEEPERVIMKLDDFLRLYEENKGRARAEEAPRDHALSSARYRGEVVLDEGKPVSAVFTAKMRV